MPSATELLTALQKAVMNSRRPTCQATACDISIVRYTDRVGWRVEILDRRVERELDALAMDVRQRFLRIAELIELHGLSAMHEPYVKHLEGKLWEMRMKGKDGIARAIYVTATGERVVVVHAFTKKSQRTPKGALEVARQRAKEVR